VQNSDFVEIRILPLFNLRRRLSASGRKESRSADMTPRIFEVVVQARPLRQSGRGKPGLYLEHASDCPEIIGPLRYLIHPPGKLHDGRVN
jgi:hypothetical protein